jgi:hypothetical protein
MLTQRLETQQANNTGTLTIKCPVGGLAELIGLAEELRLRSNVTTEGTIHHLDPQEVNPPVDE